MSSERRFQTGDAVRILEGPYRGFNGVVTGDDSDAERVEITVPVFGRSMPLLLARWHVEKIQ